MPPFPAPRCSPGREHKTENSHKRGQSFDSGLTLKAKDDDLVLFNEVQNQERDNFLLHTTDDFEDTLSKLKHLSDFKFGINIPSSGKNSDLLNVEGEKNDYDWLLTPPETPLFPTLDEDDPQLVNPAPRGRRSQPIPISRSFTDKNYQTSRTSYSPQRLSPSPQSSGASSQMKGRSSSARQSSPPSVTRSTTPTQRSCTPPNKSSTPAPRSSTPTLRRTSTSSSMQASNYGGRGASPVKASRGYYASPKSQGWQISGFNSEAPSNLRTSLSDRPVSHVRGSSPASINGRELSMKLGGKLMSPTSSRSISSSHSQERHLYSKGSVAYSGDDDEESLHSIKVGISRSTPPRKDGVLTNNKAMPFSRQPSRTSPTNSVPKRSFDSSLRLTDQRKTPQSMFRPLLSSVPATTFRPIFSRNSSLTTSSNTSSEQGVISAAAVVEDIGHEQTDLSGGWERAEDFESHEEVFLFDKVDQFTRDTNDEALSGKHRCHNEDFYENLRKKFNSEERCIDHVSSKISFDLAQCADSQCDIDGYPIVAVCSKCIKVFHIKDRSGNKKLCKECDENGFCTAEIALTSAPFTANQVLSPMDTVMEALSKKGQLNSGVPEFHKDDNRVKLDQHGGNIELGDNFFQNIFSMQLLDENESQLSDQHLDIEKNRNVIQDCRGSTCQSSNHAVKPSLKVDVPESAGISVLLQQGSASTKWPILQGKSLSATNIFFSEPSYSRNNGNALRRSFGLDSSSATSSIDLGLSGQTETYVQYQLARKSEVLGAERDIESYAQSMSSDYDTSTNCHEPRHLRNKFDQKISSATECLGYESSREILLVTEGYTNSLDPSNLNSTPLSSRLVNSEDYISVHADSCRTISSSESRNLNHQGDNDLHCSPAVDFMCAEEFTSSLNTDEDPQSSGGNAPIIERSDINVLAEMDDHIMVNHTFQNVILDAVTNSRSMGTTESLDGYIELEEEQTVCMPFHKPPSPEHSNEHTIAQISENDISLCSSESVRAVLENGESAIMVAGPSGNHSRNLTLEEATDTILFCSSIIHDLAYKATAIAMEKDQETLLACYAPPPTVTIMEKPIPVLREESGNLPNKQPPRSQKFKRKKAEAQSKSPLRELKNENYVNVEEFTASKEEMPDRVDSAKPPKLESKCNCSVM